MSLISEKDKTRKFKKSKTRSRKRPQSNSKPSNIKLFLHEKKDFKKAIRHALVNSYRWTSYNIKEIRTYLKDIELNLNPVTIELISSKIIYIRADILSRHYLNKPELAKELYDKLDIEWTKPKTSIWIERLINLWDICHTYRGLIYKNYSIKEWFEHVHIDFPLLLEEDYDIIITNRKDLERTGIFEDLEFKIKKELKIDDEIEHAIHNWNTLSPLDKDHIKILFNTKAIYKNHPYYILLKEHIDQE